MLRIEYSSAVLAEIEQEAMRGFCWRPAGGVEVGGVLFGVRDADSVRVTASRPIPCEHAYGPDFILSRRDLADLGALLDAPKSDTALRGLVAVGWYHSRTRTHIHLSRLDLQLFDRYFPQPWQIALVVRPESFGATKARTFFRDQGEVAAQSRDEALPAIAAPAAATPPPLVPVAPQPERRRHPAVLATALLFGALGIWAYYAIPREQREGQRIELREAGDRVERVEPDPPLRVEMEIPAEPKDASAIQLANPEAANSEAARAEAAKLGAARSETARPEATKVEAAKAETAKSQTARREAAKPEAAKLEPTSKLEAAKREGARPEAARPEGARPEATRLEAARSETAKFDVGKPETNGQLVARGQFVPPRPAARPPAPPILQTAPQLGRIGPETQLTAALAPAAMPPPPPPPPKPAPARAAPAAPRTGVLIWTGRLARNGRLRIEGNRASAGAVTGALPGGPVRVRVYPAELTAGGIHVYSSDLPGRTEPPGPRNGWNQTTYIQDPRLAGSVKVQQAPSAANGWGRVDLEAAGASVSVVLIEWESI